MKKILPPGIYAITCEKRSLGRKNIEVVKELIKGRVQVLQYREKEKSLKEKFYECKEIAKIARDNGILFIVNDDIDIAMLVDADGVHIGQDDLPIKEVRKLVGDDKLIGLSTHNPQQALEALKSGADYIGVGPIFPTNTKENVCEPVGLEYLEYVVKNINLPFVAIGGIKENNIELVLKKGAKTIAMVTELTESSDIAKKIKSLKEKFEKYGIFLE